MGKKKPARKSRRVEKVIPPEQTTPVSPEEGRPFDFGGLPDRDLKKNLGCG